MANELKKGEFVFQVRLTNGEERYIPGSYRGKLTITVNGDSITLQTAGEATRYVHPLAFRPVIPFRKRE